MPSNAVLTVEIENQEIPCLFSQLVQNGVVLDHPEVQQRQPIPPIEQDTFLNLVVQPSSQEPTPSDPSAPMTHNHTLAPLANRAAQIEQTMIHGSQPVSFHNDYKTLINFLF